LKISQLANTGTFTKMFINVCCPYEIKKERMNVKIVSYIYLADDF